MFDIDRAEKEALNNVNTLIAIRALELKAELRDEFAELRTRALTRLDDLASEFKIDEPEA